MNPLNGRGSAGGSTRAPFEGLQGVPPREQISVPPVAKKERGGPEKHGTNMDPEKHSVKQNHLSRVHLQDCSGSMSFSSSRS